MKLYRTFIDTPETAPEPVWSATLHDVKQVQKRLPVTLAQRGRTVTEVVRVPTQTAERREWVIAALNGDTETMLNLETESRGII